MKRTMMMIPALAVSLLLAGAALAQPMGPPWKASPERLEKFKEKRGELLREKGGLSEAEAVRVEAVMDRYQAERHELRKQMQEAKQALKTLLDEDSEDQLDYKNNLDILVAVRMSMHELHNAEVAELRKLLTPKQGTKLLAIMERVHKRMRRMKHRRWERCKDGDCPMNGGPGGPGFFF